MNSRSGIYVNALLLCLLAASVGAQSPTGAPVSGTVFDSVAQLPLVGAVVQAALVDSSQRGAQSSAPRIFTAVADSTGRYHFASLPRGLWAFGFQHSSQAALGLESDLRIVTIASDAPLRIDLAIPGAHQVRAMKCPGGDASDGMLAGFVLDAKQGGTLTDAVVSVGWVEVAFVEGRLRTVPHRLKGTASDDGSYLVCGVAADTPLDLSVERVGYHDISGDVSIPVGSAMRRDFRMADTSGAPGKGLIVGRLVHADGDPVHTAHALIPALNLDVPVVDGAFTITGVPLGTWLIEARVIGYQPQSVLLDVTGDAPAKAKLIVDTKVQVLDAISVVGKPTGDVRVLGEIDQRSRTSFGTIFLPGNQWLATALYPADVLRAARGFSYLSMDAVRVRGCTYGMGGSGRSLIVYLDGMRVGGLEELKNMIPMRDVLAVEAYPDISSIPPLWRTRDACAVVAVWSRR
jgi:hypothetical protein